MKWPIPLWNYSINCNLEHLSTSGPWAFKKKNLKLKSEDFKKIGWYILTSSVLLTLWMDFFPFMEKQYVSQLYIYLHTYIYTWYWILILKRSTEEKKTLKWKSKGQNPNILPHHCTMDTSNFKSGRF